MVKYFFILYLLVGCANQKDTNNGDTCKNIVVDISKKEKIEQSYFIDSIKYVKLETRDDILIAKANKVAYFDSLYYILDRNSNAIYIFDEYGNYEFKVDKQGRAPDEYVEIKDFTINRKLNTIDILDLRQRKVVRYDLKDGRYVSMVSLKQFVYSILSMDNSQYLGYLPLLAGTKEFGLTLLDSVTCLQKFLIKYQGVYPSVVSDIGNLYRLGNGYGIFSQTEKMAYHYINDSLIEKYKFNYKDNFTESDFPRYTLNTLPSSDLDKMIIIASYKENKDWIIQNIIRKIDNTSILVLYSKKDDKVTVVDEISDLNHPWMPDIFPEDVEDRIIQTSQVTWESMKKLVAEASQKVPEEFRMMVENALPDDNPVLQILYLKDNDE